MRNGLIAIRSRVGVLGGWRLRGRGVFASILLGALLACPQISHAAPVSYPAIIDMPAKSLPADAVQRFAPLKNDPTAIARQIRADLTSDDPKMQQEGIDEVRSFTVTGSPNGGLGGGGEHDRAWRCRAYIEDNWLQPLMTLHQYDLIEQMCLRGVRGADDSASDLDHAQYGLVKALLADGKGEQALAESKRYFNVCTLESTARAIDLVAQALIKTGARPGMVRRLRLQQERGTELPENPQTAASSSPPTTQAAVTQATATQPIATVNLVDLGENIIQSIKFDATPFKDKLKSLAEGDGEFTNLTAYGNCLLLADQPAKAREQFESSMEAATNEDQVVTSIANVARSIRAADGTVGGANGYIIALREGGQP